MADGEEEPVARLVDLDTAVEVLSGKIEFESGEEGREDAVLQHLLRTAVAQAARARFAGLDFGPLIDAFDGSQTITTGERVTAGEFLAELPDLSESQAPNLYQEIAARLANGVPDDDADEADARAEELSPGVRAGAVELALEGLYLAQELSKESGEGQTIYG